MAAIKVQTIGHSYLPSIQQRNTLCVPVKRVETFLFVMGHTGKYKVCLIVDVNDLLHAFEVFY